MSFLIEDYKKAKVILDFSSPDLKKHSEINGMLERIPVPNKNYAYFFDHNDNEFESDSYKYISEKYKFYIPIGTCKDDDEIVFNLKATFEYIIDNEKDYLKGCSIKIIFNNYSEIEL